jgi:bifunctional DNA-binding transcriptional regulator/antitoxin component of YhaV-PrlF toxin-antitoxin module
MRTALEIEPGQRVAVRQEGGTIVVSPAKTVTTLRRHLQEQMAQAGTLGQAPTSPAGWHAQARSRSESE